MLRAAVLACMVAALFVGAGCHKALLPPSPERGKAIFERSCRQCHYVDTQETKTGPGLKGVFKQTQLYNGKAATEQNVALQILRGSQNMPPFGEKLSEQDLNDLLAYLKTL